MEILDLYLFFHYRLSKAHRSLSNVRLEYYLYAKQVYNRPDAMLSQLHQNPIPRLNLKNTFLLWTYNKINTNEHRKYYGMLILQ